MTTTVYICADSTLTYGPRGGRAKIVPEALPIATVEDEAQAKLLIVSIGRRSYDDPAADPFFKEQLGRRRIRPGYGPDHRYYYSGPEFVRDDVTTVHAVSEAVEKRIETLFRRGEWCLHCGSDTCEHANQHNRAYGRAAL